jgi:osmotically inducible lipoprotein OsmB
MKTIKHLAVSATLATLALGMAGCSSMSHQDKATAVGAGAGAVIGGAAVGGVVGNQAGKTN